MRTRLAFIERVLRSSGALSGDDQAALTSATFRAAGLLPTRLPAGSGWWTMGARALWLVLAELPVFERIAEAPRVARASRVIVVGHCRAIRAICMRYLQTQLPLSPFKVRA